MNGKDGTNRVTVTKITVVNKNYLLIKIGPVSKGVFTYGAQYIFPSLRASYFLTR